MYIKFENVYYIEVTRYFLKVSHDKDSNTFVRQRISLNVVSYVPYLTRHNFQGRVKWSVETMFHKTVSRVEPRVSLLQRH